MSFIKSVFKFKKSESQPNDSTSRAIPELDLSAQDKEEDGFLMVGKTRSERTEVGPYNNGPISFDTPFQPMLERQDVPPAYDSLVTGMQENSIRSGAATLQAQDTESQNSSVIDIPFKLNERLEAMDFAQNTISGSIFSIDAHKENMKQYEYDFKTENNALDDCDFYSGDRGFSRQCSSSRLS